MNYNSLIIKCIININGIKKKNFINTFFKIKDNLINIVYTFFALEITLKKTFV